MKRRESGSRTDGRREAIGEIIQAVQRIVKVTYQFTSRGLRDFGVSGPQVWALRTLVEEGRLTVGELATRMYLHISTVSVIADRLEKAGLVDRERSEEDRRVVHLSITPHGRELVRKAPVPPRARLPLGLDRLNTSDLLNLQAAMSQLSEIMGISKVPPSSEA
ncbi:MAG: MarR family transcriptional regulator [Planctomycetes bacterium]|nr:MarR family transcriptional regulator [Planctomycetota bacterium]